MRGHSSEQSRYKSLPLWSLYSSRKKANKQAQCKCQVKSNMEKNAAGKGGRARSEDVELYRVRTSLEQRINEMRALGRYLRKSM